jgi:hypothetical protein
MKRLLFISTVVAACAAHADEVKPTTDANGIKLTVVWGTRSGTAEACAKLGAWGGAVPRNKALTIGCNAMNRTTNTCTVYAVRPHDVDDAATILLGHEVAHCLMGAYHEQGAIE